MFKNVIVGVDEQQGGRDAVALAKELVAKGGELALAYVHFGDPTPTRGSSPAFEATERQRALELLSKAREEAGVEAELLCTGSPSVGRGLHELAERQHADLLVVGSCRRRLIGRVLVGDDTRDTLNGVPCAIVVSPAGYSEHPTSLSEIGVGFNGSPESEHAFAVARELATERGAKLSAFHAISLPVWPVGADSGPVAESIPMIIEQARELDRRPRRRRAARRIRRRG